jgi:hypothetical protein
VFGTKWDKLGPDAQAVLTEARPIISQEIDRINAERTGNREFIGKIVQQEFDVAKKLRKQMSKEQQKFLANLNVPVVGLSRKVGKEWYLNDKRYETLQDMTKTVQSKFLSNLMESSQFNDLAPEIQRQYIEEGFSEIRKAVREKIVTDAGIEDVIRLKGQQ